MPRGLPVSFYSPYTEMWAGGLYATVAAPTLFAGHSAALRGDIKSGYGYTYGVRGVAYTDTASSDGRSYGVYGIGGNADVNFGIWGEVRGSNRDTGILGYNRVNDPNWSGIINEFWAGYFQGDVNIVGDANANALFVTSDRRFKKNIQSLGNQTEKLMQLNPVDYQMTNLWASTNRKGSTVLLLQPTKKK